MMERPREIVMGMRMIEILLLVPEGKGGDLEMLGFGKIIIWGILR